jgi:hypothetical protein
MSLLLLTSLQLARQMRYTTTSSGGRKFAGAVWADQEQVATFQRYPEVLSIDSTGKLLASLKR